MPWADLVVVSLGFLLPSAATYFAAYNLMKYAKERGRMNFKYSLTATYISFGSAALLWAAVFVYFLVLADPSA